MCMASPPLFVVALLPHRPLHTRCISFSPFCPFLLFSLVLLLATSHFFSPLPTFLLGFFSLPPPMCLSFPAFLSSFPPLSPSVPIRRNLIGNQSFWWKNGVGLSVTVPWVLPAERGVQKRLYTGTVEGKVNAADSLSLALFIQSFSLRHTHFSLSPSFYPFSSLAVFHFHPKTHTKHTYTLRKVTVIFSPS